MLRSGAQNRDENNEVVKHKKYYSFNSVKNCTTPVIVKDIKLNFEENLKNLIKNKKAKESMFEQLSETTQKYQWLAPILLRVGIGSVFFLFGIDKFFHVQNWMAYIPAWLPPFVPMSLEMFMYIQGVVETLLGVFLIIGFWSRASAFLCAVILGSITIFMGYNEIAIRDFGLFLAALALSLREQTKWSVDAVIKERK